MAKYDEVIEEKTATVSKYRRFHKLTTYSPLDKLPLLTFQESQITEIDGVVEEIVLSRAIDKQVKEGQLNVAIPLINPDGTDSGNTMTVAELLNGIESLYFLVARTLDNG